LKDDVRDAVIAALDRATGVLNRPEHARALMAGGDLRFDAIGIDSLSLFEMIMEVEERLGLELDADLVAGQESVAGLVAYLKAQVA
jgi:acyl carrier protein